MSTLAESAQGIPTTANPLQGAGDSTSNHASRNGVSARAGAAAASGAGADASSGVPKAEQAAPVRVAAVVGRGFEDRASWWSKMTFSYLAPVFRIGMKRPLIYTDLGELGQRDSVERSHERFRVEFGRECERAGSTTDAKKLSMFRVIMRFVGYPKVALISFMWLVQILSSLCRPIVFRELIVSLSDDEPRSTRQWVLALLMLVIPTFESMVQNNRMMLVQHEGTQLKSAIKAALYRKALRLSNAGLRSTSRGQVMTVMSADTPQMQLFLNGINTLWTMPLLIAGTLYLLYQEVGGALLGALGVLLINIPITTKIMRRIKSMQRLILRATDERTKVIAEILSGIAVVKLYAWDVAMRKVIEEVRARELKLVEAFLVTLAIGLQFVMRSTVSFMKIAVFLLFVKAFDGHLDPATAFTALILFQSIRMPFMRLPWVFVSLLRALVAAERIASVLCLDELPDSIVLPGDKAVVEAGEQLAVVARGASFQWEGVAPDAEEKDTSTGGKRGGGRGAGPRGRGSKFAAQGTKAVVLEPGFALTNVNLAIPRGKLVGIVGPVGSGKTTLLQGLLGEVNITGGSANVFGAVGYVEQQVWIMNATLRQNVLFGQDFDEARYWAAIDACALRDDLSALQGGDACEIGERGVNLSGGQKVRVSCARAVYARPSVVFADDPLAAVDAHVAEHLWTKCVRGALEGTTRLVVMNQLHFLPQCDLVVVMDEGRVSEMGTFDQLVQSGLDFASLIERARGEQDVQSAEAHDSQDEQDGSSGDGEDDGEDDGDDEPDTVGRSVDKELARERSRSRTLSIDRARSGSAPKSLQGSRSRSRADSSAAKAKARAQALAKAKAAADRAERLEEGRLVLAEKRHTGRMRKDVYLYYFRAAGVCLWPLVLLVMGMSMALPVVTSFWLGEWSAAAKEGDADESELDEFLVVFMLLSAATIVSLAFQALVVAKALVAAAKTMHGKLLRSVLAAPMSFFDITPKGRIINRFARDMSAADMAVGRTMVNALQSTMQLCFDVLAVAIATKGTAVALLIPLSLVYWHIAVWMRRSAVEVKRMESIANSPVFSSFAETMAGLTTIRAFGLEGKFVGDNNVLINTHTVPFLAIRQMQRWLNLRMNVLGAVVSFAVAIFAVATAGFISVPWVAVALTYAMRMTGQLTKVVQAGAEVEVSMNSIERIKHYSDNIVPEGTAAPVTVPDDWPRRGDIDIRNLSVRYRENKPLVLKDVSAKFAAGERVGVCGRTGSGKSTLLKSVFRINEAASGAIYIDGVDISRVPLPVLRSRVATIPQDPVLFVGTVASNLDPFGVKDPEELWQALERVKLHDYVASLPGKLSAPVAEGGDNFSQGQRQMMCFARALLRNPRLLLLDEATANVDHDTDAMIQLTLRSAFPDVTIVTIAHRIHTIMDSDKVLVLDQGRVVEFAPPHELMKAQAGVFRSLAETATTVNSSLDAPVATGTTSEQTPAAAGLEAKPGPAM